VGERTEFACIHFVRTSCLYVLVSSDNNTHVIKNERKILLKSATFIYIHLSLWVRG
jgi:hypothetical protein